MDKLFVQKYDVTTQRMPQPELDVSFKHALIGHYIVGTLEGFILLIVLLILNALLGLNISWDTQLSIVFLGIALGNLIATVLERPIVRKAHHPTPGGWTMALCSSLPTPLVLVCCELTILEPAQRLPVIVATLCLYALFIAYMRPWEPGDDRAQTREKIRETQQMTRQMLQEIREEKNITK